MCIYNNTKDGISVNMIHACKQISFEEFNDLCKNFNINRMWREITIRFKNKNYMLMFLEVYSIPNNVFFCDVKGSFSVFTYILSKLR